MEYDVKVCKMEWLQNGIWFHDLMVARFQDAGWNMVA
jgi:hypothetical protein